MFGRIVTIVAIVLAAAGIGWALWPRPVAVEIAMVERGNVDVMVEEEGKSRIREVFTISTPVTGELQRLSLHAGDDVVGGETVVAVIRPVGPGLLDERSRRMAEAAAETAGAAVDLATAQVAQAQRQLDFAESTLERNVQLSQRDLIPDQALEQAQYQVDLAKTALASAQASLLVRQRELANAQAALIEGADGDAAETCCVEVRAPISGRILQVLNESEQVVQAGTPLMTIGDPANIEIAVDLLSRDAVQLAPGAPAVIDGWGGPSLDAQLERIDPIATTRVSALGVEEQRTTAVLKLLGAPRDWQGLGHGFRVVAHIVRWRGEDILTLPIGALFRVDGQWAVFVVRDGKAVTTEIELGERNRDVAQVVAGLQAGDAVILHPADTIVSGTAVVVRQETEAEGN